MTAPLVTVDWKLFQIMPYIILLKVRKIYWPTTSRFGTARQKPMGEHCRLNVSFRQNRQSRLTVCFHLLPPISGHMFTKLP